MKVYGIKDVVWYRDSEGLWRGELTISQERLLIKEDSRGYIISVHLLHSQHNKTRNGIFNKDQAAKKAISVFNEYLATRISK